MDFEYVNRLPCERFPREIERTGTRMMSDITMLTISVTINIAIIMLAMLLRET